MIIADQLVKIVYGILIDTNNTTANDNISFQSRRLLSQAVKGAMS